MHLNVSALQALAFALALSTSNAAFFNCTAGGDATCCTSYTSYMGSTKLYCEKAIYALDSNMEPDKSKLWCYNSTLESGCCDIKKSSWSNIPDLSCKEPNFLN